MKLPRRVERRRHERMRLGGSALLLVDPRGGLIGVKGKLVDLSEGGCRLSFRRHVDQDLAGRLRLSVAGTALWLPVVTRHIVSDGRHWTVHCAFGALTTKKHDALRTLLFELSLERDRRSA
ncbi:MAG TPA: PilZ domain-containing protein [Acidimicrobiia bacterium]|jgi:hypothetical protein|nr:PilZ domain-containing protein [Acidimicrobiia bacterium]